jgi:LysR family hydrogen peroxide-inducible transcriptional activator
MIEKEAMIDPRLLRTFKAVCDQGSMGGAARQLQVAQPSISVAIRQLERSVQTPLLVRGKKGVTLTDAGQALLQRAERLENLLHDAEEAVALAAAGTGGPLRIGGTPGALVTLVPSAIARIERLSPFSVQIVERSDEQLHHLLRRGEIEVAVVTTGVEPPPPDMAEVSVARDPFALVVGKANDHLGPSVRLAALTDHKWVLPRAQGGFHRQIQALFMTDGTALPRDVIRCDSLLLSKELVRRGERITLLPRGVVAAELRVGALRAIPVEGNELSRQVGVRTLAGRGLSDLAERFLTALMQDQDHSSSL